MEWREAFQWLGTDDGGLAVWGAFTRLFAAVWCVALASYASQILALSGSRGIAPVRGVRAALNRARALATELRPRSRGVRGGS